MNLKWNAILKAQLLLAGQAVLLLVLLFYGVVRPVQNYLKQRSHWQNQNQAMNDIKRKLEDRKLLEAYDETFRQELDQNLEKLKPFLQNQEYLREMTTRVSENRLNLESMDVDSSEGLVRISLQVTGSLEQLLTLLHGLETHPMPLRLQEWRSTPQGNALETRLVFKLKEMGS